ncbi:hypothetical protein V2J09_002172 [Rumex salicifolius]
MLKHCGGLPLTIVALGGILSTRKTISEWKDVQENISSYLMSGEGGHHNFPEDYKISAQRLYQLWQAGLLTVKEEAAKSSYHVGERDLNELVQRFMV